MKLQGKKLRKAMKKLASIAHSMRDDRLAKHAKWVAKIKAHTEGGHVGIYTSGIDCDGVQYESNASILPAHRVIIDKYIDDAYYWADGPMAHHLVKPSKAHKQHAWSRDLAAEAFENGHPHTLRTC